MGYVPIFVLLLFAVPAVAGELENRVNEHLKERGHGPDALGLVGNVVRHEVQAPPGVPALVGELLAQPLAAADAAALFARSVPQVLHRIGLEQGDERSFEGALARYVAALADEERFLEATADFVRALRSPALEWPAPRRFASPIGRVVIGGPGADRHGPDAALIIDPGGDDVYERAPPPPGAVSVIVDLAGDDRYGGSDIANGARSALIDLAGNDRYVMQGAGLGAAIEGTALLLDLQGDDYYEAASFGQGAAERGLGALIDRGGNDRYVLQARGQGYGAAGGMGLLWDAAGDDDYLSRGVPDAWGREGGQSFSQGAAEGLRSTHAGGIGLLRDDAGNDRYDAQMFAQGSGYYFGLGLLWDGAGNDRFRAVRYGQGGGVHQAIGVLRDDQGDDDYTLTAGVGQGAGHDMAIGLLIDAAGDDRYAAQYIAQGTALENGLGVLADLAGSGRWQLGADARAWGKAQGARGLPSFGVLVHDPASATFVRPELPAPPPVSAEPARCPEPAAQGELARRLLEDPHTTLTQVKAEDFNARWMLGNVLPCATATASEADAARLWAAFERVVTADPNTPLADAIAHALRRRPPPPAIQQRLLDALDAHHSCGVRALALWAWPSAARARRALGSTCWREQAVALQVLPGLGREAPPPLDALPSFLRQRDAP